MALTGGKRKVNKSLKAWVAFVKKVQKEEKLSYKDAIHRAKVRKDKGEKWMMGGSTPDEVMDIDEEVISDITMTTPTSSTEIVEQPSKRSRLTNETDSFSTNTTPMVVGTETIVENPDGEVELADSTVGNIMNTSTYGGKRRRTMRKGKARSRGRTVRKSRGRGKGRGRGRH